MLQSGSIADLLRRARGGEKQAVEELLAGLRPHLENLARRYIDPGCATESTADLVQEAVFRIWQKLDQFRGGADEATTAAMFHDWLDQLVRHLGLDRQRERHAQCRQPPQQLIRLDDAKGADSSSNPSGIDPAASGPSPSSNAGAAEQAQWVRNALEKLSEARDRDIVRLCFFEGLSLRQIAERLNLSYDKVRERYHYSLRVLERELGGLL